MGSGTRFEFSVSLGLGKTKTLVALMESWQRMPNCHSLEVDTKVEI